MPLGQSLKLWRSPMQWKFNEFSSRDENGILSRSNGKEKREQTSRVQSWKTRFSVLIGMGAIAGTFSVAILNASPAKIRVNIPAADIVQNIPETVPPLSEFFK